MRSLSSILLCLPAFLVPTLASENDAFRSKLALLTENRVPPAATTERDDDCPEVHRPHRPHVCPLEKYEPKFGKRPTGKHSGCCGTLAIEIDKIQDAAENFEKIMVKEVKSLNTRVDAVEDKVDDLGDALTTETNRRIKHDKVLTEEFATLGTALKAEADERASKDAFILGVLEAETKDRKHVDHALKEDIDKVDGALKHESHERMEHDKNLLENLEKETHERVHSDSVLQAEIKKTEAAVETEVATRISNEAAIRNAIISEIETRVNKDLELKKFIEVVEVGLKEETRDRVAGDEGLRAKLEEEEHHRVHSDKGLKKDIDTLESALKVEVEARRKEDRELNEKLRFETADRVKGDAALHTEIEHVEKAIHEEEEHREKADTKLAGEIAEETRERKENDGRLQEEIDMLKLARCDAFNSIFLSTKFNEFTLGFPGKHYAPHQACAWRVAAGFLPERCPQEFIFVAPVDLKFQDPADKIEIFDEFTGEHLLTLNSASTVTEPIHIPIKHAYIIEFVSAPHSKPSETPANLNLKFYLGRRMLFSWLCSSSILLSCHPFQCIQSLLNVSLVLPSSSLWEVLVRWTVIAPFAISSTFLCLSMPDSLTTPSVSV